MATAKPVARRRLRCPDKLCQHIHAEGKPCHVFVHKKKLNLQDSDDSDSDSNSDSDSDSDASDASSDDEDDPASLGSSMLKFGKKAAAVAAKAGKSATSLAAQGAKHTANLAKAAAKQAASGQFQSLRLETPEWAKELGMRRCNCLAGVPHDNPQFIPVPQGRLCGTINVNDEGLPPPGGWRFKSLIRKYQGAFKIKLRSFKNREPSDPVTEQEEMWRRKFVDILRGALPFVNPRTLARARAATSWWDPEIVAQPHYQDMHQFKVILEVEAHNHAIQSCFGFRGFAYTAGDTRVKVWDMRKLEGNLLAECARDTCELTCILEIDAYLYAASLNGVVRQWSLPFNPKNVEFRGQLWLHNKNINDMAHWRFGSESKLFTACDDRECRVWDLTTNRCVHAIEPNDRQQGTLRSVACSDHMLFIGSSNGNIYVYLTEVKCRRTDRHVCNVKGAVQYCPQCTLRYGPDDRPIVVSALETGGFHHRDEVLFAGGEDGNIWIYPLPEDSLEMQPLVKLNGVHDAGVTSIRFSWAHVITAANDGCIKIFSSHAVNWGESGEGALERKIQLEGRVRCISIADEDDIEEHVAYLYAGTNRGRLYMIRLGGYI